MGGAWRSSRPEPGGGQNGVVKMRDLRAEAWCGEPLQDYNGSVAAVRSGEVDGIPVAASGDYNGFIPCGLLTSMNTIKSTRMHFAEITNCLCWPGRLAYFNQG